ncbi:LuxR C-terminal-related transcriptional regulator [Georgenia subflava]|uniref:Helix-turn-helix transcriptional regulator n=1 Tax=Georgenia subflava TaxID=1622177 RepID=A0A6N7ER67_9MICO|nr:LuxR C-terminal-related transcriptional regulator [Georgenia subflava]MPV37664.1 helix-turn-helix transcriptional regulator [Georgenia subflava]
MTVPVLDTKVRIPRRRTGTVDRTRLLDVLSGLPDARLTLLSAQAGFGKTTLLTEWLATDPVAGRCVAWVSLDTRDNDPAVFWRYVVAAVHAAAPDAGARAQALLQSRRTTTERVLATLVNDVGARADDLTLVLDDYHVIDSPEVRDGVAFLLENQPPTLHVVIASRADPALPLARWRARGDLVEVRADDLRFTTAETASYLTGVMGLTLTPDQIASLDERTEGWIAALQLAALSIRGRGDVAGFVAEFAGDDRHVVDYLAEEVLQGQPVDVRDFLLQTSVLTQMSGSLCDAVTEGHGSAGLLETLDRRNLFVVPLDDRRRWYRYHHLFADVLRARLVGERPAEAVAALHRRASAWYETNGPRSLAIHHALAGGDAARAADLLEVVLPELSRDRQEVTMRAWIQAIPDDILRTRPVLSVAYAGALMVRGEVEGVEQRLRDAEQWLRPTRSGESVPTTPMVVVDAEAFRRLPGAIAVYRAGQAHVTGDVPGTMAHAGRVLELAGPEDHVDRGAAQALLALACWTSGDLAAAERWYTEAVRSLARAGHYADVLGCRLGLSDVQVARGGLRDAMATFERGLAMAAEHGSPPPRGTGDMHVGMARLLIEQNRLDDARDHLRASEELGELLGLPQNRYRWCLESARLCRAEGDPQGALDLLHDAEAVFTTDYSPDVRPLAAVRARVLVALGAVDEALEWVRREGLSADDDLTYVREFEHLTLARVLLAVARAGRPRGHPDPRRLLTRLQSSAEDGGRTGAVVEALVLQALAHHAAGDADPAVDALDRAARLAEPEGYVRLFLDEGDALSALLGALVRRAPAGHYAHRLAAAAAPLAPGPRATPRAAGVVERLSARELEVLRLLTTDLDGPQIARELVVTLNTVRTHTKNIYAKLGVNNRRAAVRRAGELDLLSRGNDRP